MWLVLLAALTLIPASGALAAAQRSGRRHSASRRAHRAVRHGARCARQTRHSRTKHRSKHHSRRRRVTHSSCSGGTRRGHHGKRHHKRHASARRKPVAEHPHPAVSHVAEGGGSNAVTTPSSDAGPCVGTGLVPNEGDLEAVRGATLCLVNRERSAHGEGPLATNSDLQRAAQGHSESMASGAYFEHTGPGGTLLQRIMASGYLPGPNALYSVGENIAYGSLQDSTPGAIVAAWMASPGHRANILNSSFREVGIGVSPHLPASLGGGETGAMYTQDFGVVE